MLRQRLNRSRVRARRKLNGNIDMTPILDMTFLLLIAFIITFPALQSGIQVNLPSAEGDPLAAPEKPAEPLAVTIDAAGALFVGDAPADEAALEAAARERVAADPKAAAHIRADESIDYGRLMQVVSALRRAGLTNLSLVTKND